MVKKKNCLPGLLKTLRLWFSTFVRLCDPLIQLVPHVVVMPNHKIIIALLCHNFAVILLLL